MPVRLRPYEPKTASQQSAYDKWLDQTSQREEARLDRVDGAVGVIPTSLWIVLFFIAAVIFIFTLRFADSGARAFSQALLMGSVTSVIAALFLLLTAPDKPFHTGVGGLEPVAMERTLRLADQAFTAVGSSGTPTCDSTGKPLTR